MKYELTQDEKRIIDTYRKVNAAGKKYLLQTVEAMQDYPKFLMTSIRIVKSERG